MARKPGLKVLLSVAALGLIWGLNWPAVKTMLSEIPPFTIRAVAMTFAAVILGGILIIARVPMRAPRDEILPLVGTGLLVVFGFNVLVTFGQQLTETASATIIAFTMPALTCLFAAVLLRERLEVRHQIAVMLATCGILTLASQDIAGLLASPLGPLLVLGSAISWALGNVAAKARQWTLSPIAMAVWFLGASATACWPFVLVFEPLSGQAVPSVKVAIVMAFHIAGPMILGYVLFNLLVINLSASIAAIATLLTPFVGVSSAIILLGDPFTWQKVVALALILGSIVMTFAFRAPARQPP
ncbi:MAG: DMT family transporter [Pseudomonadota bacterium]